MISDNARGSCVSSVFFVQGQQNEKEPIMKITSFIITLTVATALVALRTVGLL